jgi:hypothetical protein
MAPASDPGALPLNVTWLRRSAEARVCTIIPLPLAETMPLPGWTLAWVDPLPLDPLPVTPPPPVLAIAAAGSVTAPAAAITASTEAP